MGDPETRYNVKMSLVAETTEGKEINRNEATWKDMSYKSLVEFEKVVLGALNALNAMGELKARDIKNGQTSSR